MTLTKLTRAMMLLAVTSSVLTACGGSSASHSEGNQERSLTIDTPLLAGDDQCYQGGVVSQSGVDTDDNGVLSEEEVSATSITCDATELNDAEQFNRVATFPVCLQLEATCNTDTETAAEILAVSGDGNTLIYSDSPGESIGFVDISDVSAPSAAGQLTLGGEPTSVAVKGGYALVAINTSTDFVNVSGQLDIIDIDTQSMVHSIALGGQPDSVAVSPDGNYAAVVLENERDEDLNDGQLPQSPAGALVIVDLREEAPSNWTISTVDLTSTTALYAGDPEPEYVDINRNNIAVVTLQENNHLVLVDLTDGRIVNEFSAGSVDVDNVDATEGSPLQIDQSESLFGVLREPDGVSWINDEYFATADEGDLDGGSRGFTVFNLAGEVVYSSGATLDHLSARLGHYPDKRSGNKGNEPENIEQAVFGDERYMFVNAERASVVFVYNVADPTLPLLKQVLPAASGPEGGLAIPSRNLLVVASEVDERDEKRRSAINIYEYQTAPAAYPTVASVTGGNGTPIPWGGLSGLTADRAVDNILYAVEDSFYRSNRILTIDASQSPAQITQAVTLKDTNGIFAGVAAVTLPDDSVADDDPTRVGVFDEADLALLINDDDTVNVDPEGIAYASDGGFWVASEGSGTVGDASRPVNAANFLFKTDAAGVIEAVVLLPEALNAKQVRFGLEGVAEYNGKVYVILQRAWTGEAEPRIGMYDPAENQWTWVYYPLDSVASQHGGWIGLSDISSLGNGEFLIIERDNQAGPDAAVKRLYSVDLSVMVADQTVSKIPVRDLMSDLSAAGGMVPEKIEGSAVMRNGDVYIINDNDGVDDNSGETQLINLGNILSP